MISKSDRQHQNSLQWYLQALRLLQTRWCFDLRGRWVSCLPSLRTVVFPVRQSLQGTSSRFRKWPNFSDLVMIQKAAFQHQNSFQWCSRTWKLLQTRCCFDLRSRRVHCLSNPRLVVFPVHQVQQGTTTWSRWFPYFGDLVMIQKAAFQRPNSFQWCLRTWKLLRMRCVYDHRWLQNIELLLYHLDWSIWINI